MMTSALRLGLLALSLTIAGCAPVVDATNPEPIQLNPGKRSLGTVIDDQKLETVAKVNIRKSDAWLAASNISVVAFNGTVLLTGQVPTKELRERVGETVRVIHGVRQVFNETEVRVENPLISRSNDSWLTTKVKTTLLTSSEIEGGRIKVVTEAGVVYLMGLLTRAEADRAANIVSTIGGVQKVVKAIEYLD